MVERKPEAQTLQARMGFTDSDLKTPRHDEIMLWLEANLEAVCKGIFAIPSPYTIHRDEAKVAQQRSEITALVEELRISKGIPFIAWQMPPPPPVAVAPLLEEVIFEQPVMNNKYTVGFVDLQCVFSWGEILKIVDDRGMSIDRELVRVLLYRDLWTPPIWQAWPRYSRVMAFEVKSSIPSLGEVIRQIRLYEQYLKARYVIVSPDDRWADILARQNIGFIKVP